jgi:adenylyl- and sulfurtransferase ThiI
VKYELIIIRYGEIGLKARYTRQQFENKLASNIKKALNREKIVYKLQKKRGRLYLYTEQIKESINVLKKIFGITTISPAVKTKSDMKLMTKLGVNISKEIITKKDSFALRINRDGKHNYTSQDVAIKMGNEIVKTTKTSVDLTNPNFKLFIEIKDDNAFFFVEKIYGPGGLPLGTQGNVMVIIDSPFSILSSWYMMRRGCNTVFAIKNDSMNDIVKDFNSKWNASSVVFKINSDKTFYTELNKKCLEYNCNAIVTDHTLSMDPKEIINEINNLKKHLEKPVLTPLIAMNVDEIKQKLGRIGIQI